MTSLNQQLIEACQKGDIHSAKKLLEQGANPDGIEGAWKSPITTAAENGHTAIIQLLVQYGANPRITRPNGWHALHYAVRNRKHSTAQYLITQLKLDPNSQDQFGQTSFILAARKGDIEMLKLLIQHGANPHTTDRQGRTALHYAIEKRHHDATQYLITQLHLDPNTQDDDGITPFMLAAEHGDIAILHLLIQHGANPHIRDTWRQNALHHAVIFRQQDIAEFLITQLQIDPNTQDHEGETPFMFAAKNDDIDMLKMLIRLGADPYITDKNGRIALHHAVIYRHLPIAQYLITQLNFDPDAEDHKGTTPFMLATQNGDIKMLHLLTQLGANPHATDRQGRNALHYVTEMKKHHITQYLVSHLQLDPNSQDYQGNTPLLIALQNGYVRTAKTLIQLGANPKIPNHQRRKPIAIARRCQIRLEKPKPSTITL